MRWSRPGARGALALLVTGALAVLPASSPPAAEAAASFTFGAAGDHGSRAQTAAVLRRIGASGMPFFLSLGDLSYDSLTPAAWCQYVKDNLNAGAGRAKGDPYGERFPFALTIGNHDQARFGEYTAPSCLPDRLGTSVPAGSGYGREYAVHYPAAAPIATIIVAAPGLGYSYAPGTAHHRWLSDTIDSARRAGRWVIVANHFNVISAGSKTNEAGSDYFNLLVSKKVDLILQGHDHTYQRSKQLAHSAGCPAVPTGRVNVSCIVASGADGRYRAGAGSVLLINGTGGQANYPVSAADSEAGYFARLMGSNTENASGFSKFTVTESAITASYQHAAGGSFADSFTISRSSPPPAPLTFAPTEDASVQAGAPTANAGNATSLWVDGEPVERALLKFHVTGLNGRPVRSARLRLYPVNPSNRGGEIRRASSSWSERTVTWDTMPAADSTPLASLGPVAYGSWVEADVTALVKGDGVVSVRMDPASPDGADYSSREAAANRPQLVVTPG